MDIKGDVLLDTHVWLWFQGGDSKQLKADFVRFMESLQVSRRLYVSAVSVWEIANLVARGRIELDRSIEHWVEVGLEDGSIQMLPLSARILIESTRLPGDVHGDPADRMLIATAREHNMTLVTRDKLILSYAKRGHVNVLSPK